METYTLEGSLSSGLSLLGALGGLGGTACIKKTHQQSPFSELAKSAAAFHDASITASPGRRLSIRPVRKLATFRIRGFEWYSVLCTFLCVFGAGHFVEFCCREAENSGVLVVNLAVSR